MSMATLERAIRLEAIEVTGITKLRNKDIQEWVCGDVDLIEQNENEARFKLPKMGVSIAIKKELIEKAALTKKEDAAFIEKNS